MAKVLVTESNLTDIGDAIRDRLQVSTQYLPSEMGDAVRSIRVIDIDTTLTRSGYAADAKVVGDRFDNLLDRSLSIRDCAAEAKATGEAITDLQKNVDDVADAVGVTMIEGFVGMQYIQTNLNAGDTVAINSPQTSSNFSYKVIDVSPGDKITLNATGGNAGRLWAFIDSSNALLSKADANAVASNLVLTAPANAVKLVLNVNFNATIGANYIGTSVDSRIAGNVDATLFVSGKAADARTVGDIVGSESVGIFANGYFLTSIGSVVNIDSPSSGAGWSYCIIPCKTEDHIIVSAGAGSNPCQYAWLDSAYKCIGRSNQVPTDLTENNIVVAPLNASYILVNSSTRFLDASKRKLYNLCMHGSDIFETKQGIENEIIFSDNENLRTIYRRKGSSVLLSNGVTVSTDLTGVISISGTAAANDTYSIIEKYNPTVIVPNAKYEIEVIGLTGRTSTALQLSVRQTGESSASILLTAWRDGKYVITTPATIEYFRMFFTLLNGGNGNVTVTVNVRSVGADGIYRTSIFGNSLIRAVKEAKKKYGSTVIIDSGTIDIVEDFINCYGESFFTSYSRNAENGWGIVLTNGITLRGLSDSCLVCNPGQYQTSTNNIATYFSPLMLAGDCTLENLKIISENTKYCVHDDWMDKTVKARHVYKNCVMIKNDSLNRCLGGGLTNSCEIIIEDCYFKDNTQYPVSYHNCINANALSRIVIDGCYFDNGGIRLANYGESTEVTMAYIHGNSYKTTPQVVFESASYQIANMDFVAYNNEIRN